MLKYEVLSDALSRRIEAEKRTGSFEKMGFEETDIVKGFWILGLALGMVAIYYGVWM